MSPRTVVLADLHLTARYSRAVGADLAAFVRAHAGARVVFAGDLFDLSAEPTLSLADALEAQPEIVRAFGEHVTNGGELWTVAGNHDAELASSEDDALSRALDLHGEARARLVTTPWFFRIGDVHVEHGHLYDPDNAPGHPLVASQASLGVHMTREFIAPTGAYEYLNENADTPLALFLRSFTRYGARAPYVIYRFFHAAVTALAGSGARYAGPDEAVRGDALVDAFAERMGVDPLHARTLLRDAPSPTLASMRDTFSRLYLDRVAATIALGGGAALLASGRTRAGTAALAAGAIAMTASWAVGHNRYRGTVIERLAEGARLVEHTTGARAVVFGHTHHSQTVGAYTNTGSFAFSREEHRPYLEIERADGVPSIVARGWPRPSRP
jgi:UDP-2,3-diacylglucosamine pyrophosphatase LpxH